jgi:hypothetical protein
VSGGICTCKRKDVSKHSDEERQSLIRPVATIHKSGKHLRGCTMIGQVDERNNDGKKAGDMEEQYQALKFW